MSASTQTTTMPDLAQFEHFYLMGIKGVAMTSLAQILKQLGKQVRGSDVVQDFVTQPLLDKLNLEIDQDFNQPLPAATDCLIYTSAHRGCHNPQVKQALAKSIPAISQAQALAYFFNQKQGIAVCGVGGKSTVSAMITWILTQAKLNPSYSVGVGKIMGLDWTGRFEPKSKFFVAEADEYVTDPSCTQPDKITPRFSFLKPSVTVCTNLKFDHPDVYQDLNHTKQVFYDFFKQIKPHGSLIFNADNKDLVRLAQQLKTERPDITLVSYGENQQANFRLINQQIKPQTNLGQILVPQDKKGAKKYELSLPIPGKFNLLNALAAVTTVASLDPAIESLTALETFHSTKRRFEKIGQKRGVTYYDDYAHHPHELKAMIQAIYNWHPKKRVVVAFQPHTYSRTKQLLPKFINAFAQAKEVLLLDIFSSAREKYDPTVSSDLLAQKIKVKYPQKKVQNLKTIQSLADFCSHQLNSGDILITLGAGDIYLVHDIIGNH